MGKACLGWIGMRADTGVNNLMNHLSWCWLGNVSVHSVLVEGYSCSRRVFELCLHGLTCYMNYAAQRASVH